MAKPLRGKYIGFTKDATADEVRERFRLKFGREPVAVVDTGTIWLVGPVDGSQDGDEFDDLAAVGDLDIMSEQLTLWEA